MLVIAFPWLLISHASNADGFCSFNKPRISINSTKHERLFFFSPWVTIPASALFVVFQPSHRLGVSACSWESLKVVVSFTYSTASSANACPNSQARALYLSSSFRRKVFPGGMEREKLYKHCLTNVFKRVKYR